MVNHPLLLCTAQKVFQWFRHAGPLVSVRVNVDIGFPERTCILEYWEEEDAQYARTHCHTLHSSLKGMQPFTLRTFNPATLLCSVCCIQQVETAYLSSLAEFRTWSPRERYSRKIQTGIIASSCYHSTSLTKHRFISSSGRSSSETSRTHVKSPPLILIYWGVF